MARRRLLAENLAAIARGVLLMLAGILLFGGYQDVVKPETGDVIFAILAAGHLYYGAFTLMPEV